MTSIAQPAGSAAAGDLLAAPPAPLAEGEPLWPGYRAAEHLSRGQDYDVYHAWSEERRCGCAVKVLRPDRAERASSQKRLINEGRLLLELTHPHIVRLYELQEAPPMLVIETLTGETVEHMIATSSRRLALADVAMLGLQLCSAVGYLHGHGVLHLDLKPSNVVCENGQLKLLDLSLARAPGPVKPGIGTRPFMAPEQMRGGLVDEASDVWGAGTLLYIAAAGHRPLAWSEPDSGYHQDEHRAEPLRSHRRVPAALAEAIDACLELDPKARPGIDELFDALESFALAL
jgi:serine/threonine protein kinase